MKRNRRFRRHTNKKTRYGGMDVVAKSNSKNKSIMNPMAKEWHPLEPVTNKPKSVLNPTAVEWNPLEPIVSAPSASVDAFIENTEFDTMYKKILVPLAENAVAIDCEMVGVGPEDTSALAHVAITDFNGNKIYEKYVIPRGGIESITNYRTPFSGIKRTTLLPLKYNPENSFDIVKEEVHAILNGRIIVGHGLDSDFAVLEYIPFPMLVWDSTKIPKYLRTEADPPAGKPFKLKALAAKIGNNIQKNEVNANGKPKGHSPLEDARAAMNLFRTYLNYPKVNYLANGRNMRT